MATFSRRPAFTLVEMLVVISIIGILAGITFPIIGALQNTSREGAAISTLSAAVDTARNFATTSGPAGFDDVNRDGTAGDLTLGAGYSGAAIVFTPGGELRIVENDPNAEFSSGTQPFLELKLDAGEGVHNGYRDVSGRDYLLLPDRIGVAAVLRNNSASASGRVYLPPPFALRFDENGVLINRQGSGDAGPFAEDGHLYYDADANGEIVASGDGFNQSNPFGAGAYNPDAWDWRGNPNSSATLVGSPPRHRLPYEQLTPVVVVAVFDLREFRAAGGWDGFTNSTGQDRIDDWMQDNARFVFFNRSTGVVAR